MKFTINLPKFGDPTAMPFYVGDETGSLYVKHSNGLFLCLIAKGGCNAGDAYCAGDFTKLNRGTIIEIEV